MFMQKSYVEVIDSDSDEESLASSSSANVKKSVVPCCSVCGSSKNLARCGRCRVVSYCSVACQQADWAAHKLVCRELAKKAENDEAGDDGDEKTAKTKKEEPAMFLAREAMSGIAQTVGVHVKVDDDICGLHVAVNDGEVVTAGDLVRRVLQVLSEERRQELREKDGWRLYRKCQERPLDPDDCLGMMNLGNLEVLVLRIDKGKSLRLCSSTISQIPVASDTNHLLINGIPDDATVKDVTAFLAKRFELTERVVLKKPNRLTPIKNLKKTLAELNHLDYLVLDYTTPLNWRLSYKDQVLSFIGSRPKLVAYTIIAFVVLLMLLSVYIFVVNLPTKTSVVPTSRRARRH